MKHFTFLSILCFLGILFAGCTGIPQATSLQNPGNSGASGQGTVDTMPVASAVDVAVLQKDPIYSTVDVVFNGGNGQVQVSSLDVSFTPYNGKAEVRKLNPEKGSVLTFQGTKETDHVIVVVTLKNGNRYRIIDQDVPYRTRA